MNPKIEEWMGNAADEIWRLVIECEQKQLINPNAIVPNIAEVIAKHYSAQK